MIRNPWIICEHPSRTDPRLSEDAGAVLVSRIVAFKNIHCIDIFLNHNKYCILSDRAKGLHGCEMLPEVEALHGPDVCTGAALLEDVIISPNIGPESFQ